MPSARAMSRTGAMPMSDRMRMVAALRDFASAVRSVIGPRKSSE